MENLFVSKEIAKQLKEIGFFEPCMKGVRNGEEFTTTGFSLTNHGNMSDCALPLFQQVMDWFREKHNMHFEVRVSFTKKYATYSFCIMFMKETSDKDLPMYCELPIKGGSYYVALSNAIKEAIKQLSLNH